MSLTRKEEVLKDILSAVAQHKFAKTDKASKLWYDTIRERLKEYYDAIAEECYGRNDKEGSR